MCVRARRRRRRSSAAASARTSSSVTSTIGSVKTAPVEARIAFGFHGSARCRPRAARRRRRRRRCAPSRRGCRASRCRPRRGQGRVGRQLAVRDLDDGEHAFRLGAVAIFASTRALTSSPPCRPVRQQLRRDVDRARRQARPRARARPRAALRQRRARCAAARAPSASAATSFTRGLSGEVITLPDLAMSGGSHRHQKCHESRNESRTGTMRPAACSPYRRRHGLPSSRTDSGLLLPRRSRAATTSETSTTDAASAGCSASGRRHRGATTAGP